MLLMSLIFSAVLSLSPEADLNVRLFGAKGDGVTDDSAAFTAAGREMTLRAARQARRWGNRNRENISGSLEGPRPRIFVPKGRYLLKNTSFFEKDLMVVGEDGAEIVSENASMDSFYVWGAYRVRIENLTFIGGRHQLFIETLNRESANLQITRCIFRESSDVAIYSPSFRLKDVKGYTGCSAWNFSTELNRFTTIP